MTSNILIFAINVLLTGVLVATFSPRYSEPAISIPEAASRVRNTSWEPKSNWVLPPAPKVGSRELFRRPVVVDRVSPPPQALPPEVHFRLQGVIQGSQTEVALVSSDMDQLTQRLHVGDELMGWTLRIIERKAVTFVRGAEIKVIRLDEPITRP